MSSLWTQYISNILNIGSFSNERGGNEVNILLKSELYEILLILLSESWKVNDSSWQVHVLSLSKLDTIFTPNDYVILYTNMVNI